MKEVRTCEQCGAVLDFLAPEGLCPRCVLATVGRDALAAGATDRLCSHCGGPLPREAWEGLCPKCLVGALFKTSCPPERVETASDGGIPLDDFVSESSFPSLQKAKPAPTDQTSEASSAQIHAPPIRYFGDYELLEEIARGGMGVVYKARQTSLNRLVAVKMILTGQLASPSEVQRFHTEAEAAAQLDHANIVPIYEVGEHEGQHYFSMKLVAGPNLAQKLSSLKGRAPSALDAPLSLRGSVRLLAKVARAVHYAHQCGILHRDIKPTNILLDAQDEPQLTDFGLARLVEKESRLTQSMAVLGSANYMAPEQAAGHARQLTTATDVYGLGAVLYEMLTGRPPFHAETFVETLRQVVECEPIPPSQRAGDHGFKSAIDKDLETICLKCLNKDSQQRYGSAEAVAVDLEHWLAGEPIVARPIGRAAKAWRWCRRNPVVSSLAVVTLILLLAVTIGSPIAAIRIHHSRQQAEENEKKATDKLWDSYVSQARAYRWSGRAGHRFQGLDVLAKAADIWPKLELRNEAIASMALPDLRPAKIIKRDQYDFVGFDASYERYARSDDTGNISICQVADDSEVTRLPGFGSRVARFLRFSSNRRFLAAHYGRQAGNAPQVGLWDLNRSEPVLKISPAFGEIMDCDFSADGRLVAFCQSKGPVLIYDMVSGQMTNFLAQSPGCSVVRFAPSGRKIALARYSDFFRGGPTNSAVEVWDMTTGRVESLFHPNSVRGIAWHPDGGFLATACDDALVRIWDATTSRQRSFLNGHRSVVSDVQFSHRGDLLFSFGYDTALRVWDWCDERQVVSMDAINSHARLSDDDHWLGCGLLDGRLAILEVTTGRERRMLHVPSNSAYQSDKELVSIQTDATYCSRNGLFATAHGDGCRLWDLVSGRLIATLPGRTTHAAIVHPNGQMLFIVGLGRLEFWPVESSDGGKVLTIGPPEKVQSRRWGGGAFCLSQDGSTLASGNLKLTVMDVWTRRERILLENPDSNLSVGVSPNAKWVGVGSWNEAVQVRDLQTGKLLHSLARQDSPGDVHVLFSPDSKRLVVGTKSEYRLWNTADWTMERAIPKIRTGVKPGVSAFTPDGTILALVISKGVLRLVRADSGEELASLESPSFRLVSGLAFSNDGTQLAAICGDRGLELWDLRLIRQRLAAMNLDWTPPLQPTSSEARPGPITVTVMDGTNGMK